MNSMDIYAAACCLFPLFPPELPSIAVLREVIVHFMAPGGSESTTEKNLGLVVDLAARGSDKTCLKNRLQDDYKKCLALLLDSSSSSVFSSLHCVISKSHVLLFPGDYSDYVRC